MPESPIITMRMTDPRAAQVAALEALTGLVGPAAVMDFALATTLAQFRSGARTDLAQQLRHIAERLGGATRPMTVHGYGYDPIIDGGELDLAIDALHALAEELAPGSGADLDAYLLEEGADDRCD